VQTAQTAMRTGIQIVTLFSPEDRYNYFIGTCCLSLLISWRWRQQVSQKHWCVSTELQDITPRMITLGHSKFKPNAPEFKHRLTFMPRYHKHAFGPALN